MIILHVPHASRIIPPEARADIVLDDADLKHELDQMTDSFTDVIAARAQAAAGVDARVVASPVSRLVVDVERFTDGSEPMEAVGMGAIYTRTHDGRVLRERIDTGLLDLHFHPHAAAMNDAVDQALTAHGRAVIIDVHSYPTERLPYEMSDADTPRPQICIGTDGFHTRPWLLDAAREAFEDFEVGLDSPFAGTYAPLKHYATDGRVASIMIEIRRDQYMDEGTVALHDGVERVVEAVARLVRCAGALSDRGALTVETDVVARARTLAIAAHEGQVDKASAPYWTHPERVARRVRELYPDAPDEAVAVAWLHDVIEDTDWTADGLRGVGFSDEVVDAVVLLTRTDGVPSDAYYAAIRGAGSLALMVKHADITDNLDEERLARLDAELSARLRSKYAKALAALGLPVPGASAALPPGRIVRLAPEREKGPVDMTAKKILYIDMDNTLVDFSARLDGIHPALLKEYDGRMDELPGVFALMPPVPGALEALKTLSALFDTYILSTAPWQNPSAWQHKVEWVHLHLGRAEGTPAYKRLILSHHKNLNRGDFLVDDRPHHRGADRFQGEVLHFGPDGTYKTWPDVVDYLRQRV